jgi:hypothetical protein
MITVHLYEPDTVFLSEEGKKVHNEVESIMEPIIVKWINERNYHPIELESAVVGLIEYLIVARFAMKSAKEKHDKTNTDTGEGTG